MLILFKKQILLMYTKFTGEYERYPGILVLYHATYAIFYFLLLILGKQN